QLPGPPGAPVEGYAPPQPPAAPGQGGATPLASPAAAFIGQDMNARLDGPNIPQELRGKTLGEAIQTYAGMRNVVLQAIPGPGAQPPQGIQQPPPVAAQAPGWDWKDPRAGIHEEVRRVINETVMPARQPMIQANAINGIQQARNPIAAEIPGFVGIEAQVMEKLRGADPQS